MTNVATKASTNELVVKELGKNSEDRLVNGPRFCYNYKVFPLTDMQAILVRGSEMTILPENHTRKL